MRPLLSCLALYAVVVCSHPDRLPAQEPLPAGEEQAIAGLLSEHPGWRLASDSDCINPYLAQYQGDHPGYHAYRARGDVNGDGREDLIVALARDGVLRLYVLLGQRAGYAKALALEPIDWLPQAGLLMQEHQLSVRVFYSDEGTTFHWDPRGHRLRADPAGR